MKEIDAKDYSSPMEFANAVHFGELELPVKVHAGDSYLTITKENVYGFFLGCLFCAEFNEKNA